MIHISRKSARAVMAALITASLGGGVPDVFADTAVKFTKFVEEVTVKGDLRLRHENIDRSNGRVDRQRQRFRLRVGADFKLPNHLAVKTRVASGGGDQTSTNQTFDDAGDQKGFFIDRAFLVWKPCALELNGGRLANPFWVPYAADVVWDGDINPEGFAQKYKVMLGETELFVNALQWTLEERGGSTRDIYAFSEQIGLQTELPAVGKTAVALAYHDYANEREAAIGAPAIPGTNTRVGGSTTALVNEFGVLEISASVTPKVMGVPINLQTTFVKNTRHMDAAGGAEKQDTGVQAGVIVNKAKAPGSFEFAYFWKEVEADAVIDFIADADFGADGGTNRQGHTGWIKYALTEAVSTQVKYLDTRRKVFAADPDRVKRLQVDLVTKF